MSGELPVAVIIGATSKWQADGRNTKLAHGEAVDDSDLPVGVRWGVGGAVAQKFAREGFNVVLTTRHEANALPLQRAIADLGGRSSIVELDLESADSISRAFAQIREQAGVPEVLVYNAGYLEGRDLPPEMELLEYIPVEMFDTAQHISSRGPFLVAKEVLPGMRERGTGSFLITNNAMSLRGRKRMTGQSLYYMGNSNLKHKILAVAEEEGVAQASYALKLLQSDGKLRIATTGKVVQRARLNLISFIIRNAVIELDKNAGNINWPGGFL